MCLTVSTPTTGAIIVLATGRHTSLVFALLSMSWGSPNPTFVRQPAGSILPVWDKPALACLSSRFPYGTQITPERLSQVGRCESVLRDLGFRVYRVRYHETVARIEVASEEFSKLLAPKTRDEITRRFREAGFTYVALDLQGHQSGSLNEAMRGLRRNETPQTGK